jgi:hypothetical protein
MNKENVEYCSAFTKTDNCDNMDRPGKLDAK